MSVTWFCQTCAERIEEAAVEDHEDAGHDVKGVLVPERLLANDPWRVGEESDRITDT